MRSLKFFWGIFFFLSFSKPLEASYLDEDKKYQLVVCAVFQNEEFFLKEWLEFHKLMGVEHFYLYNNLSSDHYQDILKPYIEAGDVDLFEWDVVVNNQNEYFHHLQLPVYNHALAIVKEEAKWAAFLDLDEFLFPVIHDNLIDFLEGYQDCAALAVNWQVYGTSGIKALPPQGLITEHLTLKANEKCEMHRIVKLIVQSKFVNSIPNPHFFMYEEGAFVVNSCKRPLEQNCIAHPVVVDQIRINHYWFGTQEWFIHNKLPRRKKWGFEISPVALRELIYSFNQIEDPSILRFIPKLRQKMYAESQSN